MEKSYAKLISETRKKIHDIRQESQNRIIEAQKAALAEVEHDFALLGWNKNWNEEQLTADGQYERLEQSVADKNLKLVEIDSHTQIGTVDGCSSSYRVSGTGCSCSDFAYRGLPCKHMYFLAAELIDLYNEEHKQA